ncbi:MAG: ethanolamine ammonia-lyase subunit EutC [Rhodoferax sp.]|uniref:ethanolamine ammonia-lyase subunit EutC n=1 Tax=Rhodoferax sp. TaxID=50421 RepID=UPI0013FEED08|nr:ethanolamine ammonia-lyase subunit EutC [Rhodoferax sp.]NDP38859.1 ethanolamine ammonia-lyase subunit EutC [Rhodoferax sp.]
MATDLTLPPAPVTASRWEALRQFSQARLALGRAGHSLPTAAHLAFQLAHAQARDAVQLPLDSFGLAAELQALGLESLLLHSAAPDRATYLQRPDLGRQLDAASQQALAPWTSQQRPAPAAAPAFDVAWVLADGLSAQAVHQSAMALVAATLQRLQADTDFAWSVAPITVVEQARVAIGDEIGQVLRAQVVVVLIGERPGLSSPDSLGAYLTWAPRVGLTDASRNCVSNIRHAGLSIAAAAAKLHYLLTQARLRRCSGVALKDEADAPAGLTAIAQGGTFLLPGAD